MFLSCSAMGMEVTDICMDNEPNCVMIYSNGVSCDSSHETAPIHHDFAESYKHINGDPEPQILEEKVEGKEYEVKECTTESSVEISQLCQVEKCEEQEKPSSNFEADLPEEKVKSEVPKSKDDKKLKSSVKPASKPAVGNARTNYTVPQPFALATEKRASCGTRPFGTESDVGTVANKSSITKNLQTPTATKHNQVADTECGFLLFFFSQSFCACTCQHSILYHILLFSSFYEVAMACSNDLTL